MPAMEIQNAMRPIGALVSLIGSKEFGAGFYRTMNETIGFDQCTVFVCDEKQPTTVVAEARTDFVASRVRKLADTYVAEGYLRDPLRELSRRTPGLESQIFMLSPAQLLDERYRKLFYSDPYIKHELAMTAAVGDLYLYAGFYREPGRPDFSASEADFLRYCGDTLAQVLWKHAEISRNPPCPDQRTPPPQIDRRELFERVRNAIRLDGGLTTREAEICAGIVLGYTVLGISMNLGITVNTVATHRKRAYAKLRISSQNELFARYFSTVQQLH